MADNNVVDNAGNFVVDNLANFVVAPDVVILARAHITGETTFHVAFNNDSARFVALASGDTARFSVSRAEATRHSISTPEAARHFSASHEAARHGISIAEIVVSRSLTSEL